MNITKAQFESAERGNPVEIDENGKRFVLLSGEIYDRVKTLLYDDSEMTHDELRAILANSFEANGWDEPGMEQYDNYDEHRP